MAADLATIAEAGALDTVEDRAAAVVEACERAKGWLAYALEHGDIGDLVETKTTAAVVRSLAREKELGRDAQLAAEEIVRRAERAIGQAIRKGQEEGTVRRTGQHKGNQHTTGGRGGDTTSSDLPPAPTDFATNEELSRGAYPMADGVPDEVFDEAIAEAKAEGNLSRANVVTKVKATKPNATPLDKLKAAAKKDKNLTPLARVAKAKEMAAAGATSRQIGKALGIKDMSGFRARHGVDVPADEVVGNTHHIDPNRVIDEVVIALEGDVFSLSHITADDVDPDHIPEWVSSMRRSLSALNKFRKQMEARQA